MQTSREKKAIQSRTENAKEHKETHHDFLK